MSLVHESEGVDSLNAVELFEDEMGWRDRHPVLGVVIFALVCVIIAAVIVGGLALVRHLDERNLDNQVSAYTPFENEVSYYVVLLPIGGDDTNVNPNTIILYEGTWWADDLETMPMEYVNEDGVLSETFQVPMDAVRVATYHSENSVEFSFTGNITNGSPDIMSAQAYIYRNLNDLQVNISPDEADRFRATR